MIGKKAQVATEYVIITAFILIAVTIIFTYSYITNDQSIRINHANNSLDKMANAADLIYALGPENIKFIFVTMPAGVIKVEDQVLCDDGSQGHDLCTGDLVEMGVIDLRLGLAGTTTSISRPTKAEVELDGLATPFPTAQGVYRIKVYWCDPETSEKICLERA